MIRVMIAEDNTYFNHLCCNYLTKDENIQIVFSAYDGIETLEKYNELKPDVLILDLDLPKMDGLEVINNICLDSEEKNKCNIIIVSGNNDLRFNLLNTSKVFRVIPKPADFDRIVDTVKEIPNQYNTITEKEIKDYLYYLNFNTYSDGTNYLAEAIRIAFDRPILMKNVKDIYSLISERHTVPQNTVKSSIRNSIDTMERNTTSKEIQEKLQISSSRKLTAKYFIPLALSHLRK